MPWVYLFAAGVCEILWAIGLKVYGLRWTVQSGGTIILMLLSFWLLHLAMRSLPLGTSYAIWTGIGVAGAALYGMFMLNESRAPLQIACILLILAGIVGLRLVSRGGGGG
jgi:quaternary ammonium compound-resistance protein SugE